MNASTSRCRGKLALSKQVPVRSRFARGDRGGAAVAISSPLTIRIVDRNRAGRRRATGRDDRAIQSAGDLP
jgi:hypothetical protein